jgi:hypothetical protein
MVAQEEEKTVGRTVDEGNCHEYRGDKKKRQVCRNASVCVPAGRSLNALSDFSFRYLSII